MGTHTDYNALVHKVLLTFNEGRRTENFTGFHENIASSEVKKHFPPDKLLEIFGEFVDKEIDIGSVKFFTPLLVRKPVIQNETLILEGFFLFSPDETPNYLKFNLEFKEGPSWKLNFINLATEKIPDLPSNTELLQLVDNTLESFNQAIQEGNFKTFTKAFFPSATSHEKLLEVFQVFIDKKINLSSIQNIYPYFPSHPKYNEQGQLIVTGFYELPDQEYNVFFEITYQKDNQQWKIHFLKINVE